MSFGLNPERNGLGGLAALDGVGCGKENRKMPSTDRLSQLVAIARCTRHNLVARHCRISHGKNPLNSEPLTLSQPKAWTFSASGLFAGYSSGFSGFLSGTVAFPVYYICVVGKSYFGTGITVPIF